ncbi:cytochrome P450 [Novosphingobium resinovorum]
MDTPDAQSIHPHGHGLLLRALHRRAPRPAAGRRHDRDGAGHVSGRLDARRDGGGEVGDVPLRRRAGHQRQADRQCLAPPVRGSGDAAGPARGPHADRPVPGGSSARRGLDQGHLPHRRPGDEDRRHGHSRRKRVVVSLSAANRDPRRWDEPGEFRIGRPRIKEHLAFGRGAHTCAGAPLARAEVAVLLDRLLEHTGAITLDEAHHGPATARGIDYEPSYIIRGLANLHLRFESKS